MRGANNDASGGEMRGLIYLLLILPLAASMSAMAAVSWQAR